ncbi:phytoene desaturase family protein [Nocardioides marmorisolisilvae]|uniref:Pyridine nucleotide-disulfide oxidoreductase domain-containing protein 2 n=1 Tax=Nocardioides marmorisolisilvae TaxID=1542737 RepID=A0A3N0DSE1_9ACTN|nr:NAD(P)/FAD-dependent oxidoreductase [Nocardioides marmorisolisilvae]RNL78540.1 NAD(P)/FAD-dependent oxidoreductase [Nocardioides marmorisolisilvae]
MTDFDAIVIGAGHNGLTAAVLLQRAGLRTLCLESKRYAGGMASTVELFDGYKFEIAGSVQLPTSAVVSKELGLDELPQVDLEVMSVSLIDEATTPLIYYTDLEAAANHMMEVHGMEVLLGMAEMTGWSAAPTRALGRFEAGTLPKSIDEMYACATTDAERASITEMLFGSCTDVLDRYLPEKEKHAALRGMLAFLAVNSTYRGPSSPGSAAGLAFGMAVPDENTVLTKKLKGGIGVLTQHLEKQYADAGGELRLDAAVSELVVEDGQVVGVVLADGERIATSTVVSAVAPDLTLNTLATDGSVEAGLSARLANIDHRGSYVQMHFALDGVPEFVAPYEFLNDPKMQSAIGFFATPEDLQRQFEDSRRGIVPADPAVAFQIPSASDPELCPPGKAAASAFSLWFPVEEDPSEYARLKAEMGQRVIEKISRFAPNFESLILKHTTFTPKHMGTMFGAPGGDYCHGLIHPDLLGPYRPGPKGYVDQPHGIAGLYLGSAGCYGGPGITFIPGYNAAQAVLTDRG